LILTGMFMRDQWVIARPNCKPCDGRD